LKMARDIHIENKGLTISMTNEQAAREALRALGIPFPAQSLIRAWIQAHEAEQQMKEEHRRPQPLPDEPAPQPSAWEPAEQDFWHKHSRGYSKSNLEPILRENGTLEQPHGIRKPGRPRIVATWFPAVARSMADGASLREALKLNGIALDKTQIRALYRNEEFRRLLQEERQRHQRSDPLVQETADTSRALQGRLTGIPDNRTTVLGTDTLPDETGRAS
jgi:hypothetical protein